MTDKTYTEKELEEMADALLTEDQLKKEGSKLPDNDKEIMRVIYSVYDEIDESISVKTLR